MSDSDHISDTRAGRLFESSGTMNAQEMARRRIDYRSAEHAGQRLPFHAIAPVAAYLLLVAAAAALTTYAVTRLWSARQEIVSTHGLLPNHRLNKPVTATAVELGPDGIPPNARLLVADSSNLFIGTPVEKLIE